MGAKIINKCDGKKMNMKMKIPDTEYQIHICTLHVVLNAHTAPTRLLCTWSQRDRSTEKTGLQVYLVDVGYCSSRTNAAERRVDATTL